MRSCPEVTKIHAYMSIYSQKARQPWGWRITKGNLPLWWEGAASVGLYAGFIEEDSFIRHWCTKPDYRQLHPHHPLVNQSQSHQELSPRYPLSHTKAKVTRISVHTILLVYQSQHHQEFCLHHPLVYQSHSHQELCLHYPCYLYHKPKGVFLLFSYHRWAIWHYSVSSIEELELWGLWAPSPAFSTWDTSQMLERLTLCILIFQAQTSQTHHCRAGESQSAGVECSGSLSLVPGIHVKSWAWWGMFTIPAPGRQRQGDLWGLLACQPSQIGKLKVPMRDPVSKQNSNNKKLDGAWDRMPKVILWAPHIRVSGHTHRYMYIHRHTHAQVHTQRYMCTHAHTRAHTHKHSSVHTSTCTYTHHCFCSLEFYRRTDWVGRWTSVNKEPSENKDFLEINCHSSKTNQTIKKG